MVNKRYQLIQCVGIFMIYPLTKLQWGHSCTAARILTYTFNLWTLVDVDEISLLSRDFQGSVDCVAEEASHPVLFRLLNPEILNVTSLRSFKTL
jgi:hypothetical protein